MPKRQTRKRIAFTLTACFVGLTLKVIFDPDLTNEDFLAIAALSGSIMGILGVFITGEHFNDKEGKSD